MKACYYIVNGKHFGCGEWVKAKAYSEETGMPMIYKFFHL